VSDPAAYLAEVLDRREAAARKAIDRTGEASWSADRDGDIVVGEDGADWHLTTDGSLGQAGEHVAAHDPAWTLRDVAVKRKLLADYWSIGARARETDDDPTLITDGRFRVIGTMIRLFAEAEGWTDE